MKPRTSRTSGHGVTFEEARKLFLSGIDYLEIFDDAHSDDEDRLSPLARSLVASFLSYGPSAMKIQFASSALAGPRSKRSFFITNI
jgi:hypothetical protein